MIRTFLAAGTAAAFFTLTAASMAADWPEWRGPNRDGVSEEKIGWLEGDMKEVWRMPFGDGFSAVSVVGERAYTMTSDSENEYAVCLNALTGDEIWRERTDSLYKDSMGGDGPRATPAVVDGAVYTISGNGKVYALSAETGDAIWMRDMISEFGGQLPRWGYSGSPLVIGDLVYVEPGGDSGKCFAALNKADGETVWTAYTSKPGYATPAVMTLAGADQIVFFPASGAVGVSPESGDTLWTYTWETAYAVNAATPLQVGGDRVLIASGYGKGASVVEVAKENGSYAANEVWTNNRLKSQMASPIFHDGYVYGFDGETLKCIDAATGDDVWTKPRNFGRGTLILAGGKLVVLGEAGNLAVIDATPDEYRQHVHVMALETDNKGWTGPSLANGYLYIRSLEEIACIDVR